MPSDFEILPFEVIDNIFTQILRTRGRFAVIRFILLFRCERTPTGNYIRALIFRNWRWRTDNLPPNSRVNWIARYQGTPRRSARIETMVTLQIHRTTYYWNREDTFRFWTNELRSLDAYNTTWNRLNGR